MRMWSDQTMQNQGTTEILWLVDICWKVYQPSRLACGLPACWCASHLWRSTCSRDCTDKTQFQFSKSFPKSTLKSLCFKTKAQNDTGLLKIGPGMMPLHLSTSWMVSLCDVSLQIFLRLFTRGHMTWYLEGFVLQDVQGNWERRSTPAIKKVCYI